MSSLALKSFEQWTFEELVRYNQANILIAIPVGDFNGAVWNACDLALRWKAEQKLYKCSKCHSSVRKGETKCAECGGTKIVMRT